MIAFIGIAIVLIGLTAWLGQAVSFFAPSVAMKLGLLESKAETDETFYIIEARALALNDLLFGWILPLSGLLMLWGHPWWPYFALIGGGITLYFSGIIVFSRIFLKREGKKIGGPAAAKAAYLFSLFCSVASITMVALAVAHLSSSAC